MQPVSPDLIVQAISGYMTAKYLFVASEMGLFEALANGTETLRSLSEKTNIPARTLRMVLDALTATGFLLRHGDAYQNTPVTATYLSGQPGMDLRPRLQLWDKVVYAQWATLEEAIRTNKRTYGLPEFSPQELEAFNTGVSHLTAPSAQALARQYDFGQHHWILDVAGGLGYFLVAALEQHPAAKGTACHGKGCQSPDGHHSGGIG
jgi:DNA-binding HxlR family transcriptional regulator